jgi:DNA-binding NtrC family response regulator
MNILTFFLNAGEMKILLMGDDPLLLMTDGQFLRDKGFHVHTAFNLDHIPTIIDEVKPDLVFFDPYLQNNRVTDAYNSLVCTAGFKNIPVIYTLEEDEVYLVTRRRTNLKQKYTAIADNIISALKLAVNYPNKPRRNLRALVSKKPVKPLVIIGS